MRLSFGVAPLQGVRSTLPSHQSLQQAVSLLNPFRRSAQRRSHESTSPITYLNWATISPIGLFRQSRIPSHNRCFILPAVTSHSLHRRHRCYGSIRLLVPHHSGFPIQVIPSLPQSRTIRDLPRSPNPPFVFIPTLTRHANPLWGFPFSPLIEASNFPYREEGRC